jgi:hypothetical protein
VNAHQIEVSAIAAPIATGRLSAPLDTAVRVTVEAWCKAMTALGASLRVWGDDVDHVAWGSISPGCSGQPVQLGGLLADRSRRSSGRAAHALVSTDCTHRCGTCFGAARGAA